eukprot:TRINITY_DN3779_c0_g1_i3.p1 TRINITY_DN3779_c0_g1~~TRINITY_DN3779_c0_g1_i3.p1  ORF type:complete len:330 (-),score=87.34 TRINITY_DN3779_c0_g1_i3:87-1076(-)
MAEMGYPTILLSYPNDRTTNELCMELDPADDCYYNTRLEYFTGQDAAPEVAVTPSDSIRGRLVALLKFLAASGSTAPDGDAQSAAVPWREYLTPDADDIVWSRVIVSGHSLGAGHAAFIGTLHKCARVISYGGPTDLPLSRKPVAWTALDRATPDDQWFAFYTKYEFVCTSTAINLDREQLGVFGDAVDVFVDDDFHQSHVLCSSLDPGWWLLKGLVSHGDYIADRMLDDRQRYRDVWRYLATFGNCSSPCAPPASCSPAGVCISPGEVHRRSSPNSCQCESGVNPFIIKWWLVRLAPVFGIAVVAACVGVCLRRRRQSRARQASKKSA